MRKNGSRGTSPQKSTFHLYSEKGFALVLTLVILVLITAMVTEFAYGVFTTTSALYNWKDSQRLSFVAQSGISLAVKTISDLQKLSTYTYPSKVDIPVENILEGFNGSVVVTVEDEDSRFNLNSLINQVQTDNPDAMDIFKKLLNNLGIDESVAEKIADWIDTNTVPRPGSTEANAKNGYMDSVDELLLIKGIDYATYEKLLPYVTVYGPPNLIRINVNTASIPVIMSFFDNNKNLAELIVRQREFKPFETQGEFRSRVSAKPNYNTVTITFKSSYFRLRVIAEENKIKRVVECVDDMSGGKIIYWREM